MTVLVDTSVWIAHLRKGEPWLAELLSQGAVLMHPFVVGELACGNLRDRVRVLRDLKSLPLVISATHDEVLRLIESRNLSGRGIGWIDTNLLASSLLSNCALWTLDVRLRRVAGDIGMDVRLANILSQ